MTENKTYTIPVHGIIGESQHGNDKRQYFSYRDLLIHLANAKNYDSIKLDINSDGGSVDDEIKMEVALLATNKTIYTSNSGNVASAASRLFCLADFENRSFDISKGVFLIHNPWGTMSGDSKELQNAADILNQIESDYIDFYAKATTADKTLLAAFMNENKPLTANEIESLGFAKLEKQDFQPIAFFNLTNNKQMELKEVNEKLTSFEALLKSVVALFKPKALMVADINGNELQMDEIKDATEISVGVKVTVGGESKSGEYQMPDKSIIVVTDGLITEIKPPMPNETEALKTEIAALKAELETVKAEKSEVEKVNAEFKAQALNLAKDLNDFKSKVSAEFNVAPPTPSTSPVLTNSKFTYKRK